MPQITRHALVEHSSDQMFELVNGVDDYPQFLRWCTATKVLESSDTHMKATISVKVAGITQQFTTVNSLKRPESVLLSLQEGPFRKLEGLWRFRQLGDLGSRVELHLAFDFNNSLLGAAFATGFSRIADHLVDDFVQRADQIYG